VFDGRLRTCVLPQAFVDLSGDARQDFVVVVTVARIAFRPGRLIFHDRTCGSATSRKASSSRWRARIVPDTPSRIFLTIRKLHEAGERSSVRSRGMSTLYPYLAAHPGASSSLRTTPRLAAPQAGSATTVPWRRELSPSSRTRADGPPAIVPPQKGELYSRESPRHAPDPRRRRDHHCRCLPASQSACPRRE
jgi:hypothetical protein